MRLNLLLIIIYFFFSLVQTFSLSNNKENLGPAINSVCDELSPIITPDGKTIYFCRSYCRGNLGKEDIWVSFLDENDEWTRAVNAGISLNIGQSNFASSVLADGNTILLGSAFDSLGKQIEGVSLVRRTENGWSKPENLIITNFKNHSKSYGFFLSNDGRVLLMTIKGDDSFGEKDIYVSFLVEGNIWSEPLNLGDIINTQGEEISPFLASDGVYLYFSSDGRKGCGSADVFVSKRLDDSWLNWSHPINLGPEINTPDWDAFFKITAKGDYAYFASNKDSYGQSDIFRIKVPERVRPQTVVLVQGTIKDGKSLKPILADIEVMTYPENKSETAVKSNYFNGQYGFTLQIGDVWSMKISAENYEPQTCILDLSNIEEYTELQRDFSLTPKLDSIFLMRNILFELGKENFDHESNPYFEIISKFLNQNKDYYIEIVGHSDNIGTDKKNKEISEQRAKNAKETLVKAGIPEDRIKTKGKSNKEPITSNDTEEGRALNRRVEFYLHKK